MLSTIIAVVAVVGILAMQWTAQNSQPRCKNCGSKYLRYTAGKWYCRVCGHVLGKCEDGND